MVMAFRTDSLRAYYELAQDTSRNLKNACSSLIARAAAGNINSSDIFGIYTRLGNDSATLTTIAGVQGITEYAQDQANDPAYNVGTEFTAMQNAIAGARSWVATNFPASGGFLQSHQITGGAIVERQFTPAQTAGLRTALQSVVDAIA